MIFARYQHSLGVEVDDIPNDIKSPTDFGLVISYGGGTE